jgi:predicted RNase H-like HicB family nuclease
MRTLEEYRRLPYTLYVEPIKDSDGSRYWIAEYLELRGCKTDGNTDVEAIANLQALFDEYITGLIEDNIDIAEPEKFPAPEIEEITIIKRGTVLQAVPPDAVTTEETKDTFSPVYEEAAA